MLARPLLLLGVLAGSLGACVSLSGLTGGSGDASFEATACPGAGCHHDAGLDATKSSHDAGREAGHDGGQDAPRDADATPDAHDAVVVPEASCADAIAVAFSFDAGDAACGSTGGSCTPNPVIAGPGTDGGPLYFRPPSQHLGLCTPNELRRLVADLVGDDAGLPPDAGVVSPACAACVVTDLTTSPTTLGPILENEVVAFLNIGGCVALLDPCNHACGVAIDRKELCNAQSCAACDLSDYAACIPAAAQCTCAVEAAQAGNCYDLEYGPLAGCFGLSASFNDNALTIAAAFCGNGALDETWDAGP